MSFFCCLKMEIRTKSVHRKSQEMGMLPIVTNRDNQGNSELVNRLATELFPEDFAKQAAPSPGAACFFEAKPVNHKGHEGSQRKPDTEIIVVMPGGKLLGALSFLCEPSCPLWLG
jgi:hypothetical protein